MPHLLRAATRIVLTVLAIVCAFGFFNWVLTDSRRQVIIRMERAKSAEPPDAPAANH